MSNKLVFFDDHLLRLLENVDKLRRVLPVLLGEEGVGGAGVALSPSSADPADFIGEVQRYCMNDWILFLIPVDIIFYSTGKVIVDHKLHVIHICTKWNKIRI